jgi:hypothetical protein
MTDPTRDWQRYLESAKSDPAGTVPHLSEETLAAYRAGELSPAEDETIQDHLVGCPLCSRILLELAEPFEAGTLPPFGESPPAAPDWAAVRGELARDGWFGPPRPEPVSWWRQLLQPPAPMRWAYAGLAAMLLVTALFFAWPGDQPPPKMVIASFEDPTRGVEDIVRVPLGDKFFLVRVQLSELPDFPEYRLRIVGLEKEGVFWKQRGLPRRADGTISAPARRLPNGSYVLELEGLANGKARRIEQFSFTLASP